jgi:hypothetical protein
MRTIPLFVEDTNLSVAWARAFLRVMERGVRGLAPLVVHLTGFRDNEPQESAAVRMCLDDTLRDLGRYSCQTNANLICPIAWWDRAPDRHAFFARFREFYPGLRRWNRLNRNGTYFGRLVAFGRGPEDGNQLEHIIKNFTERGVSRPTAMVASVFDPGRDHTAQRRRGFPCLNRVEFTPLGQGRVALKADYPCQFLFERAYGNYLGLCRLGKFMASEMGLELTQVTCTVGLAVRGEVAKRDLRDLEAALQAIPEVQTALAVEEGQHASVG